MGFRVFNAHWTLGNTEDTEEDLFRRILRIANMNCIWLKRYENKNICGGSKSTCLGPRLAPSAHLLFVSICGSNPRSYLLTFVFVFFLVFDVLPWSPNGLGVLGGGLVAGRSRRGCGLGTIGVV